MNPIWRVDINGNLVNLIHCGVIELARLGTEDDRTWEIRARSRDNEAAFWVLYKSKEKTAAQEQMGQLKKQLCADY